MAGTQDKSLGCLINEILKNYIELHKEEVTVKVIKKTIGKSLVFQDNERTKIIPVSTFAKPPPITDAIGYS